jgi:biotin-dependent enzyme
MSDNYYEIHAENLAHFKQEAAKAFGAICNRFGLKKEDVTLSATANLFQETFSGQKVRVVVEGINWGMNTAVYLGLNEPGTPLYSIHQLINERPPEKAVTGTQTDQLNGYAQYLISYATDILQGDTSFFNRQDELRKKAEDEVLKAQQAEAANKLAAGYTKIDTSYGETIWRKPRPALSTYTIIKEKYPNSIEVIFNESDILSAGSAPTVITGWKVELDSTITKDAVICEVSTDKVSMEVVAPQTGKLIWLLEEGIALNTSRCIALILPA